MSAGEPASEAFARAVYSAALCLLTPAVLLRYWWRGRAEPMYRHAMSERLGRYAGRADPGALWVHAVSLGETRAAGALIESLRSIRPTLRLLLTHGTATGREAGFALLREGDAQAWLPLDTPGAVQRFFAHFRPALGVLMETEIWPNLLHAAQREGVAMVLANARLSEKSRRKGERLAILLRPALRGLSLVLAQTAADAQRLRASGAREVVVAGNLKFDMTPDPALWERGRAWRDALGRSVVLAASTREGEEAPLLLAWLALAPPRPLLLIVPRHPQRFDEVATILRASGLGVARRSAWVDAQPPRDAHAADVWLGDSIGEMASYYAAAHVALLGGSFAPLGGQNLIEAAACGCPVLMGPHTFNFTDAAELALAAGAAVRVAGIAEAVARAVSIGAQADRSSWSESASAFAASHRGASGRMALAIAQLLDAGPEGPRRGSQN
ncbi:MAG: 3-deoxy-D-manno-octulosonic acid transferase [Burkholderiaceae bacterium]